MQAFAEIANTPESGVLPPEPRTVAGTGLNRDVLDDLALRTLLRHFYQTGVELADALKLAPSVVEELFHGLSQDGLVKMSGDAGVSFAGVTYSLTRKGRTNARAAAGRAGYVGPAPVSLDDYIQQVRSQSITDGDLNREHVERAMQKLVLPDVIAARLARAIASRKPAMVYGPSGNGKTTLLREVAAMIGGTVLIPYAIEMVGEIVRVYDPSKHIAVDSAAASTRGDRRWVRARRPAIWVAGELTSQTLDLFYDAKRQLYQAPVQLKTNGGLLIIDDLGRQQAPPAYVLGRLIAGLETGVDHLALHTGETVEIPFDAVVLFSTNRNFTDLAEEALLRRISYKVEVPTPTEVEYRAIFERVCGEFGLQYNDRAITSLVARWYTGSERELRGCHPRDLVEALLAVAAYERKKPQLTGAALDEACATYFMRGQGAAVDAVAEPAPRRKRKRKGRTEPAP